MHNKYKIYYFINHFNSDEIKNLDKNIAIIYRNYNGKLDIKAIKNIKKLCNKQNREFYISNNLKIAKKFKLAGVYIPSFNNLPNLKNITVPKNFKIIGSAHNKIQLINKIKQGCEEVFLAPIFNTKKTNSFLDISKFNLISKSTDIKIIALGGINSTNLKKLRAVKCFGFAAIKWIKKNRPKKIGRF